MADEQKDRRIVTARPPNYEAIAAVFPGARQPSVIFAYGEIIYNPSGNPIPPSLIAHELVHCDRQMEVGGPELWWGTYLVAKEFRFAEELMAHQVEYLYACKNMNRDARRRALHYIAHRLASPLYGRMCSVDKARRLIKGSVAVHDPV